MCLVLWLVELATWPLVLGPLITQRFKITGAKALRSSRATCAKDGRSFVGGEFPPVAGGEIAEREPANPRANQPQGGVPDRRSHSPHLAVFSLRQLQREPRVRHVLAKTDGRIARRHGWSVIEQANATRPRPVIAQF